jgi:hypothetical protein
VPRPQTSNPESLAIPLIESRILLVRREKVLLDSDLAALYQVETRALNQAVQRNLKRFPEDLMFQLTPEERKGRGCAPPNSKGTRSDFGRQA